MKNSKVISGKQTSASSSGNEQAMRHVLTLVTDRQYEKAIEFLRARAGNDRELLNAKGVCLLRLGRNNEAIHVYRDLVLQPGCTWMRWDLPVEYKTNFATALLLGGHVHGCLDMLAELNDEQNLTVMHLRTVIDRWKCQLTFWQKLNWWTGGDIDKPVSIDLVPGQFGPNFAQKPTTTPLCAAA